jgi:hypothetical protein
MKTINRNYRAGIRVVREQSKSIVGAAVLGALLLSSASLAISQVYGVRRTAVVSTPNRTVVASKTTVAAPRGVASTTTVVAPRGGATTLPHGYIAALPGGYRAVTVSGARYYTVGGVYYKPQMYGGRTVYVVAHP